MQGKRHRMGSRTTTTTTTSTDHAEAMRGAIMLYIDYRVGSILCTRVIGSFRSFRARLREHRRRDSSLVLTT